MQRKIAPDPSEYEDGKQVRNLPFGIQRTPEIMKKYLKAWLVFVFFSVFLAITTALMLATNPCAGQAAVVLGWVTLAIYVFVFIGVLVAFLRPGWAIPVFRENLRWLEKPDPRKKVQRAQTTPALESDERSETDSDTDSGW